MPLAVVVGTAVAGVTIAPTPAQAAVSAPTQVVLTAVPASTLFNIAKGQIGTLQGTAAADKYFSQPGLGNHKTAKTHWCAAFITWVSWMAGASTFKSASVDAWVGAATAHKGGLSISSAPRAGDLVAFKWDSDSVWDHMALVTSVGNGYFWTIEGNTSNPKPGKPNGVFAKKHRTSGGAYAIKYIKLAA